MDPAVKKSVLRLFTYGLYAVTAKHGDDASGMTANWLAQTSFEPPLVTLAAEADSYTRQLIEASGVFAINVYETGQRELAGSLGRTFAKHPIAQWSIVEAGRSQAARCWTRPGLGGVPRPIHTPVRRPPAHHR